MSVSPARQRNEGVQRRRELRRRKRLSLLARCWRLLALMAASTGLGWLLLRHGWVLRNAEQVQVSGAWGFSRDQIIEAAGLRFPAPLLGLNPKEIRQRLSGSLPVEQIQLQRHMLPPQLNISLRQRQAVARAQRRKASGLENGFVDRTGAWITRQQQAKARSSTTPSLMVMGWQQRYAPTIKQLLLQLPKQASVQRLDFRRNGELWLISDRLGPVRMGPLDGQLQRRLLVLGHLAETWGGKPPSPDTRALDLTNPEHPELVLKPPKAKKPAPSGN